MDSLLIESPPPQTKRTLGETTYLGGRGNEVSGSVLASNGSNSNKRRLADSFEAGGVPWGVSVGGAACVEQQQQQQQLSGGWASHPGQQLDLSPSENLDVNGLSLKRTRYHTTPTGYFHSQQQEGRGHTGSQGVRETLYKALKALFPGMSDETIAHVLEACGEDVDAAIRRLNELQLEHGGVEHGGEQQQQQRQQQQQQQNEDAKRDTADEGHEETGGRVKAAWVDALVSEMSQARDVDDAKRRAVGVLEGVLEDYDRDRGCRASASGRGGDGDRDVDGAGDAAQQATLLKENALLKRAVAIQNGKIHELGEKCKGLELERYSLPVHLKQATTPSRWRPDGGEHGGENGPPDVY